MPCCQAAPLTNLRGHVAHERIQGVLFLRLAPRIPLFPLLLVPDLRLQHLPFSRQHVPLLQQRLRRLHCGRL